MNRPGDGQDAPSESKRSAALRKSEGTDSKKPGGGAGADDAEELVLSSSDVTMPLELALRPEGPDTAAERDPTRFDEEPSEPGPITRFFAAVLAALRVPEQAIKRKYYGSRLHAYLVERLPFYRKLDEERELDAFLLASYGSTTSSRYRIDRFVRNNILFSLVFAALVFFLGKQGVDRYIYGGNLPTPVTTESEPDASSAGIEAPVPMAKVSVAVAHRPLWHCSVLSQLRARFSRLSPSDRGRVVATVTGFVESYGGSEIEKVLKTRKSKVEFITASLQPSLPEIRAYVEKFQRQLDVLEQQRDDIRRTLNEATVTRLNDVRYVNEMIQLRSRLQAAEAQLAAAPARELLQEIEHKIGVLEKRPVDTGDPSTRTVYGPAAQNWAHNNAHLEVPALQIEVAELIRRDVAAPLEANAPPGADLQRYYLHSMNDTLGKLAALVGLLSAPPYALLARLERSQTAANTTLDSVFDATGNDIQWIDYQRCLGSDH